MEVDQILHIWRLSSEGGVPLRWQSWPQGGERVVARGQLMFDQHVSIMMQRAGGTRNHTAALDQCWANVTYVGQNWTSAGAALNSNDTLQLIVCKVT